MVQLAHRASLLVVLCLLSGCASRWEPNAAFKQTALNSQTVLSATQRLREKTGIDGDPIQLDDERYRDYLDKVRSAIKAKWGPVRPGCRDGTLRVQIGRGCHRVRRPERWPGAWSLATTSSGRADSGVVRGRRHGSVRCNRDLSGVTVSAGAGGDAARPPGCPGSHEVPLHQEVVATMVDVPDTMHPREPKGK
jgi:hypothetical protein